jgi:glutamate-1-semialdehyde 2,1-aminomutase
MKNITKQLLRYIPGGAHTYSRGFDQFPSNAPAILSRGKDAYVYDQNGKKFLDYGMGLRSINIGYNNKIISRAAIKEIFKGNNLTLPSTTELKAAKLFTNIIETADMVKFAKNGSTAVTAAIKLARAYTGKEIVLRCSDHPFFSYDDWFISSTPVTKGITKNVLKNIKNFK